MDRAQERGVGKWRRKFLLIDWIICVDSTTQLKLGLGKRGLLNRRKVLVGWSLEWTVEPRGWVTSTEITIP